MSQPELYNVIEIDCDGETLNRYEYLDKHNADTLVTSLTKGTNTDRAYHIVEATLPTRYEAYRDLVKLMTGHDLPAPLSMGLSATYTDTFYLNLFTVEDFDRWVEALGATAYSRAIQHLNTIQCHGTGSWRGWNVSLSMCVASESEPALVLPPPTAEVLESVPDRYPDERCDLILDTLNRLEDVKEDDDYIRSLPELARKTLDVGMGGGISRFRLLDGTTFEWNRYTHARWSMWREQVSA